MNSIRRPMYCLLPSCNFISVDMKGRTQKEEVIYKMRSQLLGMKVLPTLKGMMDWAWEAEGLRAKREES